MPNGGKESVADFEEVVDDVQLDGRLPADPVVHATGIQPQEDDASAYDKQPLEHIGLVVRKQCRRH